MTTNSNESQSAIIPELNEGSHSHSAANLLTSQKALRAVITSSIILFVGSILQFIVVLMSGSVSLLSDTIHNFSDAATAIPLSFAFIIGRKKPSEKFNYGYGKMEDHASVIILLFMISSAIYATYISIKRFYNPSPVEHVGIVIIAALIGFIINEGAAIFRIRVGKQIHSEALITDGKHARMDGFTSLAVIFAAIGSMLGYPESDSVIGIIISIVIFHSVWESAKEVYTRMLDGVNPEIISQLKNVVKTISGVEEISETRARWVGHKLMAEVNVAVNPHLTVEKGHEIALNIDRELKKQLSFISMVVVHIDPLHTSGERHHHGA